MLLVAVGILSVFFAVGSITPLLLSDDTDGVVERRRHTADDTAEDGSAVTLHRAGKLALSRPPHRSHIKAHIADSRGRAAARTGSIQRRAG